MAKKILDIIMKILIFLTIALAVVSIANPDLIKSGIESLRWIVDWLWNWNYLIVFSSALIEAFPVIWVVIPGQNILLIVGGFFAEISTQNLIFAVVISSMWAIVWNYIWYILGKYYGDVFFEKYWYWFSLWETEVRYLKKSIHKWWAWSVILGKFHSLARAFVPFVAGSMGMKSRSFMIYNIIWSIFRSCTIVLIWVLFAKTYETVIDYIWYIFIWIMLLFILYIWKFKKKEFMQYMKEKNQEIEKRVNK